MTATGAGGGIAEPALPRPIFLIPFIVSTAFLMEALDQTIITAALPAMAESFGVTPLRLNLAITAYLLSLAVFIPIAGWIADRCGARRVFLAAMVIFTGGSILCGASQGLGIFVAARMLQGFGGAMMTPVGRLILLRSFTRRDLVSAIAYMTTPVVIGPLLGPLIGGFITTYASWRWIFFINIPIGLLGIVLTLRYINPILPEARRPFDFAGFAMCATGMVLIQLVLENLLHPFWPYGWSAAALFAALLLGAVYVRHARCLDHPAIEISLMKLRPFRIGVVFGGLSRVGFNAVPFLLQLQLQLGFGLSPLRAGLIVFVTAFGSLALKPVTSSLLRLAGFRRLLALNAVFGGALIAGFSLFDVHSSVPVMTAYVFVFGFSRSLQFSAVNALTYADVPTERQSAGVSFGGVAQQISMGLGISLSAAAIGLFITGNAAPTAVDLSRVFLIMAVVPLVAALGFLRLERSDGAEASGHNAPGKTDRP